jgi:hypothetical protein
MPDLLRSAVALVRRGVVFELRLYRSLLRWVARRTHGLAPGWSRWLRPGGDPPKGDRVVTGLTFPTDDPRALVTRARAHLPSRPGRPAGRG